MFRPYTIHKDTSLMYINIIHTYTQVQQILNDFGLLFHTQLLYYIDI